MELLGMIGGPVRAPSTPMDESARAQLRADLDATGILARVTTRLDASAHRIAAE
jgi:hypothetical protein